MGEFVSTHHGPSGSAECFTACWHKYNLLIVDLFNGAYGIVEKCEHKLQFWRASVNGRIILKWILKNGMGENGLDSYGSGQGQVAGCCEYTYIPSGYIKCGIFYD